MKRSALFISYYFPPQGGAGVFRVYKFAKYLARRGWEIAVISAYDKSYRFQDKSLLDDLPENVKCYYTYVSSPLAKIPSLRRWADKKMHLPVSDFFFLPDNKLWWCYEAVKLGREVIEKSTPELIFLSLPPFSSAFAGKELAKRYKLPLVLDFRDSWTNNPTRPSLPELHRKINTYLAKKALEKASFITVDTEERLEDILDLGWSEDRIALIPGGYDEEDFRDLAPCEENKRTTVVSAGTIYAGIHRSARVFLEALRLASSRISQIEIRFIGGVASEIIEFSRSLGAGADWVKFPGYLAHKECLRELICADFLLLLAPTPPQSERIFLSKIYEYLRASKPILAVAPKWGSMAELLRESGNALFLPTNSPHALAEELVRIFNAKSIPTKPFDITRYSRESMAIELENVFLRVTGARNG